HWGDLGKVNLIFGSLTAVAGVIATILGGIAGDALRKRFGGAYFLLSGIALVIAFVMVIFLFITPFPAAWVLVFAAEFFLFFNTGPSNAILANVTHPSIRATAFAVNIFIVHAGGDAISPYIIGYLSDHRGMPLAFSAVSVTTPPGA